MQLLNSQSQNRGTPFHFLQAALVLPLLLALGVPDREDPVAQGLDTWSRNHPREEILAGTKAYDAARQDLVALAHAAGFSGDMKLSPGEIRAGKTLAALRAAEIHAFKHEGFFPPAVKYCLVRDRIATSSTFRVLRAMPKGGLLHVHFPSMLPPEWFLTNETVLHSVFLDTNGMQLTLSGGTNSLPLPAALRQGWGPRVRQALSLGPEDAGRTNMWTEFGNYFTRTDAITWYRPILQAYLMDSFLGLIADGIDYVELRIGFPEGGIFDEHSTNKSPAAVVRELMQVEDQIRVRHPDFRVKMIISFLRFNERARFERDLREACRLRARYPRFIVGLDLVGNEDIGHTTEYYLPEWETLKGLTRSQGVTMPLFLHDGESDWATDDNLFDAVILASRRIGHGFNLFQFPALERLVIKRNLALEICPISNQMLGYVSDLRIHPAAGYLNRGVPCVLASDDPGIFGYTGMTPDFWAAFMAWNLDLAALKKLARNSLVYSAMEAEEKEAALRRWRAAWSRFVAGLAAEP